MDNMYYIFDALNWYPGFFSSYLSVIGFLNHCEEVKPLGYNIFFEDGLYFDKNVGLNWWEYYFEPIISGHDKIVESTQIDHPGDSMKSKWAEDAMSTISREQASELINKYIKVKPHIQLKIDDFVNKHFTNKYVIGVHFRGTDKSSEAPRVCYDNVKDEILKQISALEHQNYVVFIATDETLFINYMKQIMKDKIVYIEANRSTKHDPIHHSCGNKVENRYQNGEEAVIDCYLLSKTNILLRTHSCLSTASANINPKLKVINLNHRYFKQELR